ncbi:MAG: DNA polymerase III subunit gamma/tau [Armatimonadota bacterium]
MPYVPLTLKYRPQQFDEVVGQRHVSQTLMNAVASDRLVHAYLFAGPRGTGKTSTARLLAKAVNCERGPTPTPCNECSICTSIREGHALDIIEIDAASNRGIDEIRDLREKVKYSPAQCRAKVYILDEVHMLTKEAFNALLKTLEEPPAHAFFVLATTEPHKVPPTILSRCQRFDFRLIPSPEIEELLRQVAEQEGIQADEEALESISRAAGGAARDALSILDQTVAFSEDTITLEDVTQVLGATEARLVAEMADILIRKDTAAAFELVGSIINEGKDIGQLIVDLTAYLRNLLLLTLRCEATEVLGIPAAEAARLQEQSRQTDTDTVMAAIQVLNEAQGEIRQSSQHRIILELALARICAREELAAAPAPAAEPAQPEPARPEPEPAAAAEAAAPEGMPELAAVMANWDGVMNGLMGSIKACLRNGRPTAVQDGVVTITFDSQFHHDQIADRYSAQVQQALSAACGQELTINCVLEEGAAQPTGERAATVEDVLTLFPGSAVVGEEDAGA